MTQTATQADDGYPPTRYAWYVAVILTLGYVFAFADRMVVGLLTPAIQADLQLTDTQVGLFQGLAFAVFYTLFGLPMGWLADRGNRKRVLAVSMVVWSAMTAVCGVTASFGPLFLARVGVGIGEASLNPCATSLLGDYFPVASRSKAFGLYGTATAVGTLLAFTGGGLLLQWLQGLQPLHLPLIGVIKPWQATFILVGLPGLIPALLFALTVREPARRGLRPDAPKQGSMTNFLRTNRTTLICHHVGIGFVMMPVYAYVNWLPSLFQRSYGWAPAKFSITYGIPGSVMGIVGAVGAGMFGAWLKSRGDAVGNLRACAIGCTLSAIGGTITPLMPSGEVAFVVYLFTGGLNNFTTVLGLAAIAEMTPNQMRARVTAIFLLFTGLVSSSVGPLLVGLISDALKGNPGGIGIALSLVSGCVALPGAMLIFVGLKPYRASVARIAG